MPDQVIGWVILHGTPGVGVPAGTLVTSSDGRIVHLAEPALIGPEGRAWVPVASSRTEDVQAFQRVNGLAADGIPGPKTKEEVQARITRIRYPTRHSLIMADEDWWA